MVERALTPDLWSALRHEGEPVEGSPGVFTWRGMCV